jgi:hypothetical protein
MLLVTYGYHDKRGGRGARLNRALDDAERRFPNAKFVEATLPGDADDKAPIRVEVHLPDEETD